MGRVSIRAASLRSVELLNQRQEWRHLQQVELLNQRQEWRHLQQVELPNQRNRLRFPRR